MRFEIKIKVTKGGEQQFYDFPGEFPADVIGRIIEGLLLNRAASATVIEVGICPSQSVQSEK